MKATLSLIDIERFVLHDSRFTAARAERIRSAVCDELQRLAPRDADDREFSLNRVDTSLDIRPSDEDEQIARQVAQTILAGAGLVEESQHG
jgi:hypothetical protein